MTVKVMYLEEEMDEVGVRQCKPLEEMDEVH